MKAIGIIPARMASTRFPGKPLAKIMGMPMVGHVYYRTRMSKAIDQVYIATCDEEIKLYAESIGAACVMTSDQHERASDRVAEAVSLIECSKSNPVDTIVMVQGDEPLLNPKTLDVAVEALLKDGCADIVNVMEEIVNDQDFESSDVVKVVIDRNSYALYFSREPIPSRKKTNGEPNRFKQTGLIAFRRSALMGYRELAPTPLEIQESVDMLRVIEHSGKIKMCLSQENSFGVDTPINLNEAEEKMAIDELYTHYRHEVGVLE